jgi:colanic acid/amylovoran biosynthesis glycosyltransferase
MSIKLLFIVNKDDFSLAPSETFLSAHYLGMPCEKTMVLGYPGRWCDTSTNKFLPSRNIFLLGLRWLLRLLRLSTVHEQDTNSLARFLSGNEFDVVLAEYGTTAVMVMEACDKASVPLVAHFHGWDAYSYYNIQKYGERYQLLFKRASAVVAVSSHMRKQLLSLGADPIRTFDNACGADISPSLRAFPGSSEILYVMVGRLTEKKAPLVSIEAFSKVYKTNGQARLVIIGDGPLMKACKHLSGDLGLDEAVNFMGAQPHAVVMDTLSRCRCFIQHSVRSEDGDHEGTPVGVIEAMGMGLPVVSTRHGGIMDLIQTDRAGLLVDEHDVDSMAQAMLVFANSADEAASVGEFAREIVLERWTNQKSLGRLWRIVKDATESPK